MFQLRDIILAVVLIFVSTAHGLVLRDRAAIEKTSRSTCRKMISVQSHGVLNYLANVAFKVPADFDGQWTLEMETNEPFTFFGSWGVSSNSDGQKQIVKVQSRNAVQLRAGEEVSFRFRISYARNGPIPYVSVMRWQGQQICGLVTDFSKLEGEMQGDIWTGIHINKKETPFREQLISFLYDLMPATM